jgi:hypothetical protein
MPEYTLENLPRKATIEELSAYLAKVQVSFSSVGPIHKAGKGSVAKVVLPKDIDLRKTRKEFLTSPLEGCVVQLHCKPFIAEKKNNKSKNGSTDRTFLKKPRQGTSGNSRRSKDRVPGPSGKFKKHFHARKDHKVATRVVPDFIPTQDRVGHTGRQDERLTMNRTRLVPTKQVNDQVAVTFAELDRKIPSPKEMKEIQAQVLKSRKQAEADKNGISISKAPTEADIVPLHRGYFFSLTITSTTAPAILEKIDIGGTHGKSFRYVGQKLPHTVAEKTEANFIFLPNFPGVFRVGLTFQFSTCSILRTLTFKGGDKKMHKEVEPQSLYERKISNIHSQKPIEIFAPPPEGNHNGSRNPFANLPLYKIPANVEKMIGNPEFENAIELPHEDGRNYAKFYQSMLWASELQAYRDIKLFDLESAKLKREGKFFKLTVEGLAEGRPSVLRGDMVNVTWNRRLYQGRVERTLLLEVVLEFHQSFSRSFNPTADSVDVRFTFSRMTFRISHEGVIEAQHQMKDPLFPNIESVASIKGTQVGRDVSSRLEWGNTTLNDEQRLAVTKAVEGALRPLPYIIFGPPGTGKTTAVTETILQLARHKDGLKILVTAPSNDAADALVERLVSYFSPSDLKRVIAYSRNVDSVPSLIRKYTKEGLTSDGQLNQILSGRIVVCTVNLAARFSRLGVPRGFFDVLCVDEAGHASEPEVVSVASTLLNFSHADEQLGAGQIILAGDPKQLGPIVTSDLCRRYGMSTSYMERLSKRSIYYKEDGQYPAELITKLVQNYRSHPAIIELPNKMFYENDLLCRGDTKCTHSLANWEKLPVKGFPVMFHSMTGENLREGSSPSWFNPEEAIQSFNYVDILLNHSRPPLKQDDIGVITPYARQAQKIRLLLKNRGINDVKVGSVETFQGQERQCIVLSTVRSETEHIKHDLRFNLGFVASAKRFNVALTRAKALLIVIGCPTVLSLDKDHWLPFLRYCRENGSWVGQPWKEPETDVSSDPGIASQLVDNIRECIDSPSQVVEQEGFAFSGRVLTVNAGDTDKTC